MGRLSRNPSSGVTLIEMLVVVTIMALFGAIAWQQLAPVGDQGRRAAARAQIESLMTALQRFQLDEARFPSQSEGLEAVRPYLTKEIPPDPWGNPYSYRYPGEHGPAPEVISYGADGQPGGEGPDQDVESWR